MPPAIPEIVDIQKHILNVCLIAGYSRFSIAENKQIPKKIPPAIPQDISLNISLFLLKPSPGRYLAQLYITAPTAETSKTGIIFAQEGPEQTHHACRGGR